MKRGWGEDEVSIIQTRRQTREQRSEICIINPFGSEGEAFSSKSAGRPFAKGAKADKRLCGE